jgi:hypothetical protein
MSAAWGDYDNDGDLDLYVGNTTGWANQLFRNDGGGVFTDVTSGPLDDLGYVFGVAWADYDEDGDLDLYVANYGDGNKLFRNNQITGNHWLHVDLLGTVSNRCAIGARIRTVAGGQSQIREISGGRGTAQNSLTAEFGLGSATMVDTLEIRWPSGSVCTYAEVPVDHRLTITEDCPSGVIVGVDRVSPEIPEIQALHPSFPNPARGGTEIRYDLPSPSSIRLVIFDHQGRCVRVLEDTNRGVGTYSCRWDGRNEQGLRVPTGIYFYRLQAGSFTATRKLVLIR